MAAIRPWSFLIVALLILAGCEGDGAAGGDAAGGPEDGAGPSDAVVATADAAADDAGTQGGGAVGDGLVVFGLNGEHLEMAQGAVVVNNAPYVPADSRYTSFSAGEGVQRSIIVTFPGDGTGDFDCDTGGNNTRVQFSDIRDLSAPLNLDTQSSGGCLIHVVELGSPGGGVIRGTFSATIPHASGTYEFTGGSFSILRP